VGGQANRPIDRRRLGGEVESGWWVPSRLTLCRLRSIVANATVEAERPPVGWSVLRFW